MRTLLFLLLLARESSNVWAKDLEEYSEKIGEVGSTTTLHCHAPPEQRQDVDFEWTFVNDTNVIIDYTNAKIGEHERVEFIGDLNKGDASIMMKDLRLADSGEYECEWTYNSDNGVYKDAYIRVNLIVTGESKSMNSSTHSNLQRHIPEHVVLLIIIIYVAIAAVIIIITKCKNKRTNKENPTPELGPLKNGQSDEDDDGLSPSGASQHGQDDYHETKASLA